MGVIASEAEGEEARGTQELVIAGLDPAIHPSKEFLRTQFDPQVVTQRGA